MGERRTVARTGTSLIVSFMLVAMISAAHFANSATVSVNVSTDKFQYFYRDLVHVYGNVTYDGELVKDGLVAVQVMDPLNVQLVARTVPANKSALASWDLNISSLFACDYSGRPKSLFAKSETAYFNATVVNTVDYSRTILLVINVFDFDSTPVGIRTIETNLPAGGALSVLAEMSFDSWTSAGNATVFANVWSDWPSNLGRPYCPERNASFAISRIAVPPAVGSMQASYHMAFRLPPTAVLGNYQIRVCALSKGLTAIGSGGFIREYQVLGDVVCDRKIDIFDVVTATAAYDSQSGNPLWNPQADLVADGVVDIFDVTTITSKYDLNY